MEGLMGIEGVHTYLKSGSMDKISTPPGYVSQTSFVLRNLHREKGSSKSVLGQEQTTGFGSYDVDSLDMYLTSRPWIVQDHTTPSLKPMESEVHARRLAKLLETKVLEEAPVFNPTEEEFSDTLSYIASLRDRAEPYGICCIVPPSSWKPPCLLKEKKLWEASRFVSQVQLFDGIPMETPNMKKEADVGTGDASTESVKFCRIERGPTHTLESFKDFADSYKKRHFSTKGEALGSKKSSPSVIPKEPTVSDIEKEYRQLVENPLVEIEVLYGNALDTTTFGSGFPLSGQSESCNYGTSGWNLNNTPKLPGSLLAYEDSTSLGVPHLSVGMCLSSQLWKSEKERLYSLCYSHVGAPRVWYSVAGCHRSKFMTIMKSLIPEMSGEQPEVTRYPVLSPYALSMEGIPVTRCVQKPGQYVIIFPGSYYSAFDCGFNCLEKANFAPLDWLPHGDIAIQLNQTKCKKSLISYDKLLLNAAREAVKCLMANILNKKNATNHTRWKECCGENGIFSNIIKSRIKEEKYKREFLSNSLVSRRMDKSYDDVSKRECCVCFTDLHLSAVQCSCLADRYWCLSHVKKLCTCLSDQKSFLYRYTVDELNCLIEALLEGKLSAMLKWERIDCNYSAASRAISSSQSEDGSKKSNEVMTSKETREEDVVAGSKEKMKAKVKARSITEIMIASRGNGDEKRPMKPWSKKPKKG